MFFYFSPPFPSSAPFTMDGNLVHALHILDVGGSPKDAEYKLAQSGDATCNGLESAEVSF